MHHAVMHALLHLASHAVKHMTSHQKTAVSRAGCRKCSGGVTPERSVTFDCCSSLLCFGCAGPMLTELGDGEFLVQCGCCGKRRVAKPYYA